MRSAKQDPYSEVLVGNDVEKVRSNDFEEKSRQNIRQKHDSFGDRWSDQIQSSLNGQSIYHSMTEMYA